MREPNWTVPSVVVPSRNVTGPERQLADEPDGVRYAVNVTGCPVMDGFGLESSLVDEACGWMLTDEVVTLPWVRLSPE
jgi:hypothetical protein